MLKTDTIKLFGKTMLKINAVRQINPLARQNIPLKLRNIIGKFHVDRTQLRKISTSYIFAMKDLNLHVSDLI